MKTLKTPTLAIALLSMLMLFSACYNPFYDKEDYLADFKTLAIEVSENYDELGPKEIKRIEKDYAWLADDMYKRFRDELTYFESACILRDRAIIKGSLFAKEIDGYEDSFSFGRK